MISFDPIELHVHLLSICYKHENFNMAKLLKYVKSEDEITKN